MDAKNLAGSLKVAILIQNLEDQAAQVLMNSLSQYERDVVQGHLDQMGPIPQDLVEKVAQEFYERMTGEAVQSAPALTEGGNTSSIESEDLDENLHAIQALDADQLFDLIKFEHPQTIAIILLHVKTEVSSEILSRLPDELKSDIAMRIASSDKVLSGMVQEINSIFEDVLKHSEGTTARQVSGLQVLADMINQTDGATVEIVLEEIEENDPELAAEIKQLMFVFEDLVLVDDRGLQSVLRSVETSELAMALKASTEEVKSKIFANMSERAADMLREEMDVIGSVRMKEVSDAQKSITRIIQEKEAKGELVIAGRGGEEFIG